MFNVDKQFTQKLHLSKINNISTNKQGDTRTIALSVKLKASIARHWNVRQFLKLSVFDLFCYRIQHEMRFAPVLMPKFEPTAKIYAS